MNVEFYTCSDDPRKINKTMQLVSSAICTVYNGCSVTSPVIMIRYDDTVINCNYFKIPEWNRWYSIADYSVENGKTLYVNGLVDVLFTYKRQLLECNATAIRSEGVGKPTYVVDNQLPIVQGTYNITSQIFPNSPLDTDANTSYILTTLGG